MVLDPINQTYKKKPKVVCNIRSINYYKHYLANKSNKITLKQWTKIVNTFTEKLYEELYKGYVYDMPFNLGRLFVKKSKPKVVFTESGAIDNALTTYCINRLETKKFWEKYPDLKYKRYIYHDNDHSDGYIYKITWSKFGLRFKNLGMYSFRPTRKHKRQLTNIIKKNPNFVIYDI